MNKDELFTFLFNSKSDYNDSNGDFGEFILDEIQRYVDLVEELGNSEIRSLNNAFDFWQINLI